MSEELSAQTQTVAAILLGGIVAGVLDLAYAVVVYSPGKPILIPQTIASGVLGQRSYQGGTGTAALGVALHFLIALVAAALFCSAARKAAILVMHPVRAGLAYGALVYFFMHAVVLPLSAVQHRQMAPVYQIAEFIEHCLFVGLPIAFSAHYFSQAKRHRSDRQALGQA